MSAFIYWVPDVTRQEGLAPLTGAQISDAQSEADLLFAGDANALGVNLTGLGQPSNAIWFDATMSENHPAENEVTEHPVEDGPDITDHIRAQTDMFSMRCFVSNAPIRTAAQVLSTLPRKADVVYGAQDGGMAPQVLTYKNPPILPNLSNALGLIVDALSSGQGPPGTSSQTINTLQFAGPFDNVREVYEALLFLRDNGTLVEVVTSVRSYENMVIRRFNCERGAQFGTGAEFTIEFRRMNIVSTATVPAPIEVAATPKKDKGVQTPKPVLDAKRKTLAFKGLDFLGVLGAAKP